MTRTPSEHYAAADQLLADLEQVKADQFASPYVQAKVARAQIHAALAQSPWWPDLFTAEHPDPWPDDEVETDLDGRTCQPWPAPAFETRSATGDRL